MSVVGLITEYNPFHNGHLHHLTEAKKISGADTVVVVMSGNFVQRGTPAMIDKYERCKMAMAAGADLVIELPVCYAAASAEYFALGAISILDKLGFVDSIVFGSECGSIQALSAIADLLLKEPIMVQTFIQDYLRTGYTYPAARLQAYLKYATTPEFPASLNPEEFEQIMNSPNNILGIEYIKALKKLSSPITPLTITRIQSEFHSTELSGSISSATAIRAAFNTTAPHSIDDISSSIPDFVLQILKDSYLKSFPICPDDISLLLKDRLLLENRESLSTYLDISDDLAGRISNSKFLQLSFQELVDQIKSRQYTQTRIQRALLHILLKISKDDMLRFTKIGYTPYARILGMKRSSASLLKITKENDNIQPITSLASAKLSGIASDMLEKDIYASHLYQLVVNDRYKTPIKDEYTYGIIIQ